MIQVKIKNGGIFTQSNHSHYYIKKWYDINTSLRTGLRFLIAYVKGTLEEISDNAVIIDCHGLGYQVFVSPATIAKLPSRGAELKLFTYMQVKEDSQSLHGFLSQEEVRMFILLISVSGIGPKVAASMLANMNPSQIMMAIVADDAVALSKAPGVGKKTAQRITLELRDKIKKEHSWENTEADYSSFTAAGEKQDAMDALTALGYGRSEGMKAVMEVAREDMTTEQIIKSALRKLM
jgi:Holliday junction DNA helicase RuvA